MLVADASVLAPVVGDGGTDGTRYRQRLRGETVAVPDLAKIEVLSVLRRQLLNKALTREEADRAVTNLFSLPLTTHPPERLLPRCWELRDNVTPYDATYVALAEALGCTLLTADNRLADAPGPRCPIEVP